jgi:N-formylglutamate amidohydrolase
MPPIFELICDGTPILAAAIHHGHWVRPEVAPLLAISEAERLREEDPFTGELAAVFGTRIIGQRSRFEFDLNRPRSKAIYLEPADAWGLSVWRNSPPPDLIRKVLASYDLFYGAVAATLRGLLSQHERVIVLDIHAYNHRRDEGGNLPADPEANPEINIGTGTMDRAYWASVVDRFMADLSRCHRGRQLDVRENVRFLGGNFCRWIHESFPERVCAIAIEFKKFFMDEWTGEPDYNQIAALKVVLESTLPGLQESLQERSLASARK